MRATDHGAGVVDPTATGIIEKRTTRVLFSRSDARADRGLFFLRKEKDGGRDTLKLQGQHAQVHFAATAATRVTGQRARVCVCDAIMKRIDLRSELLVLARHLSPNTLNKKGPR